MTMRSYLTVQSIIYLFNYAQLVSVTQLQPQALLASRGGKAWGHQAHRKQCSVSCWLGNM